MNRYNEEKWLEWAKKLQALAQSGLTYTKDKYDKERFEELREISVEIMDHYTEAGEEKIRALFASERGYQTPKVDVRGAVIHDGKILLVHEEIDGRWSMPGGWADIYYSAAENVRKECREEAGLEVEPYKVVCVLDWGRGSEPYPWCIYKIVMLARPVHPENWSFEKNMETSEARFFSPDGLPELSTVRTTRELIDLCFDSYRDESLPTIFN